MGIFTKLGNISGRFGEKHPPYQFSCIISGPHRSPNADQFAMKWFEQVVTGTLLSEMISRITALERRVLIQSLFIIRPRGQPYFTSQKLFINPGPKRHDEDMWSLPSRFTSTTSVCSIITLGRFVPPNWIYVFVHGSTSSNEWICEGQAKLRTNLNRTF